MDALCQFAVNFRVCGLLQVALDRQSWPWVVQMGMQSLQVPGYLLLLDSIIHARSYWLGCERTAPKSPYDNQILQDLHYEKKERWGRNYGRWGTIIFRRAEHRHSSNFAVRKELYWTFINKKLNLHGVSISVFHDSQSMGGSGQLMVVQSIGELSKFYCTGEVPSRTTSVTL